jgi:hypothetical protein
VQEEFPDLLHDFAREVLRDQPENIYEYGALYFKAMYTVSIGFPKLKEKSFGLIERISYLLIM